MANKSLPIVLAASGTATAASGSYQQIEDRVRKAFPDHPIHWAYSSRVIRRRMRERTGEQPATPQSVLEQLQRAGHRQVIVQSLHLIGGIEFHHLAWQAAHSPLAIHLGLPLLSHPQDFDDVLNWIDTLQPPARDDALILVGHGTAHPSWMAYALLARQLEDRFHHRVQLGQIKGRPTPSELAGRLIAAGCRRVELRPFMLVAGAHFMQDIAGDQPTSWRTRLQRQGLTVSSVAEGLGGYSAITDVFNNHIRSALNGPPLKMN